MGEKKAPLPAKINDRVYEFHITSVPFYSTVRALFPINDFSHPLQHVSRSYCDADTRQKEYLFQFCKSGKKIFFPSRGQTVAYKKISCLNP